MSSTISVAFSSQEKAAIYEELDRILASRQFKNSKRYPLFLRFIVEKTLEDDAEPLKERTLGIEVFGRSQDYITGDDPVVRVTAGEVRKRLALYYQEPSSESGIQISLPVGSYIPQFRIQPDPVEAVHLAPAHTLSSLSLAVEKIGLKKPRMSEQWIHRAYRVVILLLLGLLGWLGWKRSEMPKVVPAESRVLDLLWSPILDFSGTINVYMEAVSSPEIGSDVPLDKLSIADYETKTQLVPASTAFGGMVVFHYLMDRQKHFILRTGKIADFNSFQNGPSVVLGLANDFWVKKYSTQMRYAFDFKDNGVVALQDKQNSSYPFASVNVKAPYGETSDDYAIVGRIRDRDTNHWILLGTGIGDAGMSAAARFLKNPQYSRGLLQTAQTQWDPDRNVEIILVSHVIHGSAGPPQVMTAYAW